MIATDGYITNLYPWFLLRALVLDADGLWCEVEARVCPSFRILVLRPHNRVTEAAMRAQLIEAYKEVMGAPPDHVECEGP